MSSKILIVEDDPKILLSLEFLIEQAGYTFQVARTGEEALLKIAEFQPDLIVLDLMLPGIGGFEISRRVRQNPEGQKVKILMLTARAAEAERRKGLGLGADRYITKPFSTRDLMKEIADLLDSSST
jgi:DNA-binding response OmpR family regulator